MLIRSPWVFARVLSSTLALIASLAQALGQNQTLSPATPAAAPAGPETSKKSSPHFKLELGAFWQLNVPGDRFDASGLLWSANGELLTINDRGPELYRVIFGSRSNVADVVLKTNGFSPAQLRKFAGIKRNRYDGEGIAQDEQGRIYICEETDRWILRLDSATDSVEKLPIDWSPVSDYFSRDSNASFEGIAVGEGKLYLANERSRARSTIMPPTSTTPICASSNAAFGCSSARAGRCCAWTLQRGKSSPNLILATLNFGPTSPISRPFPPGPWKAWPSPRPTSGC